MSSPPHHHALARGVKSQQIRANQRFANGPVHWTAMREAVTFRARWLKELADVAGQGTGALFDGDFAWRHWK
jgi:hypothetical protein